MKNRIHAKKMLVFLLSGFSVMMYGCDDDTEVEMKTESEMIVAYSEMTTSFIECTASSYPESIITKDTTTVPDTIATTVTSLTTTQTQTVTETTPTETTEQQTEPVVSETEPSQTDPVVPETEPPQTDSVVSETEPPQTEPPVFETEPSVEENSPSVSEYQSEVLRLVNEVRASEGLPALVGSDLLNSAANVRAQEIYTSFSHTRPDGSSCFSVADEMGITAMTMGENIAAGTATPADVVQQLLNSPPHRANIMSSSFTAMGVGYFETDTSYKYYWVQFFIG